MTMQAAGPQTTPTIAVIIPTLNEADSIGAVVRAIPRSVVSRVIVADGKRSVDAGSGRFLARTGGEAAKPTGRLMPDMDPERNFGAILL